ncbi:MAG: DEAD/DEAH box helicase [Chlamydiota bacterium]
MKPPSPIDQYLSDAEKLKDAIQDIVFSEGTYQVAVWDPEEKTAYWPFLQFDDTGKLLDFFCSCKQSESSGACAHLACAFSAITRPSLLHVRYKKSFWQALFSSLASVAGYQTSLLEKQEEGYQIVHKGAPLFVIKSHGVDVASTLKQLVEERVKETEETSLKFSNLSLEEMQEYKEGRASAALRFELSFWSDLAKWCFLMQERGETYTITFFAKENALPNRVEGAFAGLTFSASIEEGAWPLLIESLTTVHSSLDVKNTTILSLQKIVYNEEQSCFVLYREKGAPDLQKKETSLSVGSWRYIPSQGFFKEDDLLQKRVIEEEEIDRFLQEYSSLRAYLKNVRVAEELSPVCYTLRVDGSAGLIITAYLFTPGDLCQPYAKLFASYAYIPGHGFFPISEKLFPDIETTIAISELGSFVTNHRAWLQQFPGFTTHFGSVEAKFDYQVSAEGDLSFTSKFSMEEGLLDLGPWIFIRGEGFFPKKGGKEIFVLRSGTTVPQEKVAPFIDEYKEELLEVKNFFLTDEPLLSSGLKIFLSQDDEVWVEPERSYALGIQEADVRFFQHYGYVRDQGFFPLAPKHTFPEPFVQKMKITKKREEFFLQYEIERLKPFTSHLDDRLKKPQSLQLHVRSIKKERKKKKNLWIVDLYYLSDIGIREAVDLWEKILQKKKQDYSPAGLLFLEDARFHWLRSLGKRRLQKKQRLLRLSTIEWMRLCIMENIQEPEGSSPEEEETRKTMRDLTSFESQRLLDISALKSTLRPYQELGLQWLWFLYCHGLSGLLCDEMGLGKTHQAMAILAAAWKEQMGRDCKFIVVCPTSVIYHWQDLLERFLPNLRVLTYYGLERSLAQFTADYDLLLTSYGILRTGKENLQPYVFELAIFDEIQIAKNHHSQTHSALLAVEATMKLGLTGTPIENRIRELKAIFDIVLPGYLPREKGFRELFINPIEKHHDPEKKRLLQKLVKPFILRRKKAEVLLDLPEKIEEISYLDLSEEQAELYQNIAQERTKEIFDDFDEKKPLPYMHIFSLLSKLKQVCDHPSLIHGDLKSYHKHSSGKWEFFQDLIEEARQSQQKVVVFSQYLGMLSIMESYLKKQKIGFTSIKGSTKNRKEALQTFRDDPSCLVFVASLLAAGVGIDLSVASIVIHYDRWWNPAKEDQATDRVHRIGQNRGVQVFKLVTKNTIEEHIHQMIDAKKHLIESSIGKDDSDQIRLLSREELMDVMRKTIL